MGFRDHVFDLVETVGDEASPGIEQIPFSTGPQTFEQSLRGLQITCRQSQPALRGIEEFDRALEIFLDGLSRHPDHDRIAVLITSDHGEALYDRGYGNHGFGLFDDEAAIPLAARLPGATPGDRRRSP